jgi:ornithine carbamoyltransferase
MQHFLDLFELSGTQLTKLLKQAAQLKKDHSRGKEKALLQGKVIALIFEKPSLRTRVSFQAGVAQLGGASVFLSGQEIGLGTRETIPDFARTICNYVDAVVLRVFKQQTVESFAQHATCPVINGLSDYYHPCQALGDLLTMREELGKIQGKTVVFVGDGNNVARSLAIGCGKLGARFILAAPKGYGFDKRFLENYRKQVPEGEILENGDPRHAVEEADVLYTDVWASMGQENESSERKVKFAKYQINGELFKLAPRHARFMHCLPAHRGEEVTEEVLESDRSVVFAQAGNRMHAQKALLEWLLKG